jgi:hypothetical protein
MNDKAEGNGVKRTLHAILATAAVSLVAAANNTTANGAKLQIWSCSGGADQRWTRT